MNYLKTISTSLQSVNASINGIIEAQMYNNEEDIKSWIKNRWLTGKTPNGDLIGLYRFEDYAEEKYFRNSYAGFGNVDLTYTGAMGNAIQIKNFNDSFEVFSTVGYYDKIVDKYGEINFNITEVEKERLKDTIFLVILEQINKSYE